MKRRQPTLDKWDVREMWLTVTVITGAILCWLVLAGGGR